MCVSWREDCGADVCWKKVQGAGSRLARSQRFRVGVVVDEHTTAAPKLLMHAAVGLVRLLLQGNALGKGPVLFCLGAKGLRRLAAAAAAGDPAFQQLELDMYRLAGGQL